MIILDTDTLIEIEHENEKVLSKLREIHEKYREDVVTTSAAYAEFLYGFVHQKKPLPSQYALLRVIDFDKKSAHVFAQKRHELESKGMAIPAFDLITASCAIAHGAALVSFDNHFKNIEGLRTIIF